MEAGIKAGERRCPMLLHLSATRPLPNTFVAQQRAAGLPGLNRQGAKALGLPLLHPRLWLVGAHRAGAMSAASSSRIYSARWRRRRVSASPAVSSSAPVFSSLRGSDTATWMARIDVAIPAPTVEICRPLKPGPLDQDQCAANPPPIVMPKTHGQESYPPLSDQRSTKP
jgi:hypothetical protein